MGTFDQAAAARLRRTYATLDMKEQRRRTAAQLEVETGQHLLDVGCGPGHLVTDLVELMGASGHVTGVDPSEPMLELAAEEVEIRHLSDRVTLLPGDLSRLPLESASVDGVAIVQVLEHVEDVDGALREVRRVLRPGGTLVIVDTDWRSCVWRSSNRARTELVLRTWEERFVHPHLPERLDRMMQSAGFDVAAVEPIPIMNVRTEQDTFSLGMVGAIAEFVADPAHLGAEVAAAWRDDIRAQARAREYFFSLCRYLFKGKG